jgi:LmbE family N-acetylglucosaminyl deacetylase
MMSLKLPRPADRPLRVLLIGCHSDDIEIGCGGFVLDLLKRRPDAIFTWVVLSATGPRLAEAEGSAAAFMHDAAACKVITGTFRDGFMPHDAADVKAFFERLKSVEPDLVLTHQRNDLHQDHRFACELTWNTFRDHIVLEYEIPKWDGDLGRPSVYVHLADEILERKVELLMEHFATQRSKDWFTPELFRALPRIRGMESRSPSGYAEAFYAPKLLLEAG